MAEAEAVQEPEVSQSEADDFGSAFDEVAPHDLEQVCRAAMECPSVGEQNGLMCRLLQQRVAEAVSGNGRRRDADEYLRVDQP